MAETIRALIIEDSEDDANLIVYEMEKGNIVTVHKRVENLSGLEDSLQKDTWDIIICDYTVPGFGAIPALEYLSENGIDIPVIVVSGVVGEDVAVSIMKAGAKDFIVKGNYSRLLPAIRREIKDHRELTARNEEVSRQTHEVEKQRQLAFTMVMQNPQPLLIMTRKLKIKLANDAFPKMSGYTKAQLEAMSAHDFKILEKSGHGIKEALETKLGVTGDVVVQFPSGIHYLEQHTIPLLDSNGEIVSLMAVYNDNTDKRKRDAAAQVLALYTTRYLQTLGKNLDLLAQGDFNLDLNLEDASDETRAARDEFQVTNNSLLEVKTALERLIDDSNNLSKAAVEGRLATRADVAKHNGGYRKIIEGVNVTLDSVINPLKVAADYIDQISKGTIPQKITDEYKGDFNILKTNLNNCIDGLKGLVEANETLARMAINDHTRGVEGNYQGIFAEVKTHVNLVRERVNHIGDSIERIGNGDVGEYEAYKKVGRRSENDRLVPGFIRTLGALNLLVEDANTLAKAAEEGNLKKRADASRHSGEYRRIIDGVNRTLDTVMAPVTETLRVSKEFANTNFSARFDPSLKVEGDWIAFKDSLNNVGISVSAAVNHINTQVIDLASSAEEANASIEEVASGSAQVAKNAAGVSTNAERGDESAKQVLKAMEDLSSTVQDVATKTESVSRLAVDANSLSKKGAELARQADAGMVGITQNATDVENIVNEINAEMNRIGKIVGLITDLANQTNLLALNAAIEAARAGDAGRGFAVVATEVKSLAQESRASAENIAEMIGTLEQKTKAAAGAAAEAGKTVKEGSAILTETLGAFNMIVKSIGEITRNVEDVASSAEEQAASVEEITASVHEMTGAIQGTAREAVDAAAASEESSAAIDQISKIIGNVNVIVDNVSKEMSKFKVS